MKLCRPLIPVLTLLCASLFAVPVQADAWELFQNLIRRGQLEVALPEGALADRCRVAAQNLSARSNLTVEILEAGAQPDPSRPRIVFGNFATPGVESLLTAIDLTKREGGGFRYGDKGYGREGDSLVAWFEDPERPGLPVLFYFSEKLVDLIPYVTDFMPPSKPSVLVYHGGDIIFEATLRADGQRLLRSESNSWPTVTKYFAKYPGSWGSKCQSFLPAEVSPERHSAYVAAVGRARERAEAWLHLEGSRIGLRLYFHAHLEDLFQFTHRRALSVPNFSGPGAHVLLAPGLPDDGGAAAIEAFAQRLLGPPASDWLREGLSVAAASWWWGRDLDDQIARLAQAGIAPSIAELIDPSAEQIYSPHLRAPLRAMLFRMIVADADQTRGADLWTGERPLTVDQELERAYRERLQLAAERFVATEVATNDETYRAGFVLEPEQETAIRSRARTLGYASRGSDQVIEQVHQFGANSVTLITRAFMEAEWPLRADAPLDFRRSATQSDAALASAVGAAKRLSMSVLLQPHLLTSANGVLAGRKSWSGTQSFEQMFRAYERFAEHYALLADLLKCDVLCVGTGLKDAMDFIPDPRRRKVNHDTFRAKRERWISIFERVRRCFDGALTYAVRSGYNAYAINSFKLWQQVDFISAELFEPVQNANWARANDESSLEKQIDAMIGYAARLKRPLLITAVGFPATDRSAFDPSEPGYSATSAVMDRQAKLYEALATVLTERRADPNFAGVYLWSVSTNPLRQGIADSGFTPLGKLAEAWLPAIFGR